VILACGGDGGPAAPDGPEDDNTYPVGRITLTHLPVDPELVEAFMGLGNLNVLPEDHGGFFTPRAGGPQEPTIPVYAPADGRIVQIRPDWLDYFAPWGHDLAIVIRASTTMVISYGHMSDFSSEIWEVARDFETGYGRTYEVDIPVKAGQIVGYIGTQGALDFYIGDSQLQLDFVNPSRYPTPWLITGCYHDYYAEPQRSQLAAITLRTAEPICGKTDFDVAGRIVGNWFREGEVPAYAFDDYTTHLAIVHDELYGDRIAISDGIAIRPDSPHAGDENFLAARVFWVEGNAPRPETVGVAEGLVKYEILQRPPLPTTFDSPTMEPTFAGTFLVQMLDPGRIRVERVMGKRPDEVGGFGANARTYVR
jgi:hypothetical protein